MSRVFIASAAIVTAIAGNAVGQTTGTTGTTGTRTAAARRTVAAKPSPVRITVRDPQGARLEGVRLTVSGAATVGDVTTTGAGGAGWTTTGAGAGWTTTGAGGAGWTTTGAGAVSTTTGGAAGWTTIGAG